MTSWRRSAPRWSAAIRISSATPPRAPAGRRSRRPSATAHADESALAGVALALPALKRAEKIQRRAARVGFDWPDVDGPAGRRSTRSWARSSAPQTDDGARRRAGRPAVRRRQLCPPPRHRPRNRAARSHGAVRNALPQGGRDGRQAAERYEYRRAGSALAAGQEAGLAAARRRQAWNRAQSASGQPHAKRGLQPLMVVAQHLAIGVEPGDQLAVRGRQA